MLSAKYKIAHDLRNAGYKFKDIGKTLGVSAARASVMDGMYIRELQRESKWYDRFSVLCGNALRRAGFTNLESVIRAYCAGEIYVSAYDGLGAKSIAEIAEIVRQIKITSAAESSDS